jgi:hypothetical protein
VLAVNSRKLASDNSKGIILFNAADERLQILRGWVCPSCAQRLEFVYPKPASLLAGFAVRVARLTRAHA